MKLAALTEVTRLSKMLTQLSDAEDELSEDKLSLLASVVLHPKLTFDAAQSYGITEMDNLRTEMRDYIAECVTKALRKAITKCRADILDELKEHGVEI